MNVNSGTLYIIPSNAKLRLKNVRECVETSHLLDKSFI